MEKVLAHLAQFGSFAKQGELLCTQGLTFLLRDQDGELALRNLIGIAIGRPVSSDLHWRAEVRQPDGGRPDIEGRDHDGRQIVKIEAKLDAPLGDGQLESYLSVLGPGGVLVLIVPRDRREEIAETIRSKFGLDGAGTWRVRGENVDMTVASWEDVFAALAPVGSEGFKENVSQLRAMYRVLNGDDLEPLTSDEEVLSWRKREPLWEALAKLAASRLTPPGARVLPVGSDRGGHPYRRRYVCRRHSEVASCYSVGTRDPFRNHRTPIWLRFHKDTGHFAEIFSRLERSPLGRAAVRSGGHLWFPLEVPLNSAKEVMITSLVGQAERILAVAYSEPHHSAEPVPFP